MVHGRDVRGDAKSMTNESTQDNRHTPTESWPARRKVLFGTFLAVLGGAYGIFATFALKFVFPKLTRRPPVRVFLGFNSELDVGQSREMTLPSGDRLLLSNTGRLRPESQSTFVAFSNRCPHLGCKVHWKAQNGIFECPCHQGIFDADGVATSGPPAQAGQSLTHYPLEMDGDSIYALVEDA